MSTTKTLAAQAAKCARLRGEGATLRLALRQAQQLAETCSRGWADASAERDRISLMLVAARTEEEDAASEHTQVVLGLQRRLGELKADLDRRDNAIRDRMAREERLKLEHDKIRRELALETLKVSNQLDWIMELRKRLERLQQENDELRKRQGTGLVPLAQPIHEPVFARQGERE
jgi:chromosome segregation ATPase